MGISAQTPGGIKKGGAAWSDFWRKKKKKKNRESLLLFALGEKNSLLKILICQCEWVVCVMLAHQIPPLGDIGISV